MILDQYKCVSAADNGDFRERFARRLRSAGCPARTPADGAWRTAGDFASRTACDRTPKAAADRCRKPDHGR
jgi:hypothetical protein